MTVVDILIQTLQVLLPAYFANASPTFLIKLKKHPIDFGLMLGKNRLLGDGKTIEGLIIASIVGYVSGLLINYLVMLLPSSIVALNLPSIAYLFIGLGAMIGDSFGSFFKRRMGLPRGANVGLLDMEDFIVGSLVAARIFASFSWWTVIIALVATPFVHRTAGIIGYKIGLKKEPW